MKYFTILLLTLSISPLFGQTKEEQQLAEFSKLSVVGRYAVEVIQGDRFHAELIYGADVEKDKLEFKFKGTELTVKYSGGALNDIDLHINITVPQLTYIEAKHGAEVRVNQNFNFNSQPLGLQSISGGKIRCHIEDTPLVEASVNQGGSISLTGSAAIANYSVTTGGTIGAVRMDAKEVKAQVSMGGEIICHATETLDAKVTSGGSIDYKGDAKVTQKVRLGGSINQLK